MNLTAMFHLWLAYAIPGAVLGWGGLWLWQRLRRAARIRRLRRGEYVFLAPYRPGREEAGGTLDERSAVFSTQPPGEG